MDEIKVGDFISIPQWGQYYEVGRVTTSSIFVISQVTGNHHEYPRAKYAWKVQKKGKSKSGFGKWIAKNGI